jgi:hypothetical protein
MRKLLTFLTTAALSVGMLAAPAAASSTAAAATSAPAGAPVVIAQVYGGGGNQGGVWANDFVEVFNRSDAPVSVDGWSLQYTSASGTNGFGSMSSTRTALSGTLQPGQTLLVKGSQGETPDLTPLPTPDVDGGIQFHQNSGRVALVTGTDALGCNSAATCTPQQLARIVDLVGYGTAAFYETAPTPALTNPSAAIRLAGGCTDTDDNSKDFVVAHPTPRNRTSPLTPCVTAAPAAPAAPAEPADETPAAPESPTAPEAPAPADEAPAAPEAPADVAPSAPDAPVADDATVPGPTAPAIVPALPDPCAVPIMQPVNCDGSSVFKLGSTVPLKFEVPNQGTATFAAAHVSNTILGDELEGTVTNLTATNGSTYRYAGAAYHYNWSTKGLKAGTYRISFTDAEGQTYTVRISLRP